MDVSIWNILHDGCIEAVSRRANTLEVDIAIDYLTERMLPRPEFLKVYLRYCDHFSFTPWDEPETHEEVVIQQLSPQLLSADIENDYVKVCCTEGILQTRYQSVEVRCSEETELPVEKLQEIAAQYWKDWKQSSKH